MQRYASMAAVSARRVKSRVTPTKLAAAIAGVIAGAGAIHPAVALADYVWQSGTGDYYSANWTNGSSTGVTGNNNGSINVEVNSGLVTISASTASINVFDFRAGDTATSNGAYQQSGSTATVNSWLRLGDGSGATGVYTDIGGLLASKSNNNIAEAANSYGLFNLGGTGTWNASGGFVGLGGASGAKGYINISGGAMNVTGAAPVELGYASGATGTINVSAGTMSLSNAGNNALDIGAVVGATGLMNVTGTGVVSTTASELWVGNGGSGILNVNSGGTVNVGNWIAIGRTAGTGTVNLGPGGTINKTTAGTYTLSSNATTGNEVTFAGTTNVLNQTGGVFNASTSAMFLGENGATTSTWNMVSGLGQVAQIVIGRNSGAIGFMNLSGGTLQVNQIFKGAGNGNFYFNGGTLQALSGANGSSFMSGLSSATVNANSTIDNNGFNITIAQAIGHSAQASATDGGINFNGSGVTTIGGLNTYTGTTTLNTTAFDMSSGPLAVAGITGPITGASPINIVAGNGALGSDGNTYTGTLNVSSGAAIIFGTGGTSGSLSPASTFQFTPGASVGFDRSDNITFGMGAGDLVNAALFTGSGAIVQAGTGVLTVGTGNTLTGGANIIGTGTLNMTTGSITGPIMLANGGTLMFAAGNTTDVTTANGLNLNAGGGKINTNGMNITFNGNVTGANLGPIYKTGLGNLTINGTIAPTQVYVDAGSLVLPSAGSSIASNSYASIGLNPGDNGSMSLDNGAKFVNNNDLNIADVGGTSAGTASVGGLTIADTAGAGTLVSTAAFYVGKGTSTAANFAVGVATQSGGTFNMSSIRVGVFGNGTFNLTGGTANVGAAQDDQIASAVGSVGLINVSGGKMALAGNFQVGTSGNGTLIQSNGTITHAGGFFSVGRNTGGVGTYNISGGSFTDTANITIIGEQGTGTLNVSGTAAVNATKNLAIGNPDGTGATGTVNQSGGTVTAPLVVLGNGASATTIVNATYLLNAGALVTGGFSQPQATSNVTGTVYLNGGTIQSSANSTGFFTGVTAIDVQSGGLNFNTSGFSDVFGRVLAHDPTVGAPALDGGMNVLGGGTVTLLAANTYTGPTTVNGSTLAGTGSIVGTLNLLGALSVLAPGNGLAGNVGTFTAGTTTFGNSSDYLVDLSGATSDKLAVNGDLVLTGADGITFNGTPDGTSTYVLATYTGNESGAFSPTNLPAGYAISYAPGQVLLAPVPVPEPTTIAMITVGAGLAMSRRRRASASV